MASVLPIRNIVLLLALFCLPAGVVFAQEVEHDGVKAFREIYAAFLKRDSMVLHGSIEAFTGAENARKKIDVQHFRFVSAGDAFNSAIGVIQVVGDLKYVLYIDNDEKTIALKKMDAKSGGVAEARKKALTQVSGIDTSMFREMEVFRKVTGPGEAVLKMKSENGMIAYRYDQKSYQVNGIEMEGKDESGKAYLLRYAFRYGNWQGKAQAGLLSPADILSFQQKEVLPKGRYQHYKILIAD